MFCPKCSGRMTFERFQEFSDSFDGWRCVNCGEILDRVILQHRRERPKIVGPRAYFAVIQAI